MPDYFTLAEFRALPDCSGSTFNDAQIEAAAGYFTAIVEREVGQPFIPRTYTVTRDGGGLEGLRLPHHYVRELTSVSVGGTGVAASGVSFSNGSLRYKDYTAWTSGVDNVTVTYVAGEYEECPADVKDAVMWATRDRLLGQTDQAGIDIRRTSVTTDFGTTSYILPGEKRPTGYPDLDAVIAGYKRGRPYYGSI